MRVGRAWEVALTAITSLMSSSAALALFCATAAITLIACAPPAPASAPMAIDRHATVTAWRTAAVTLHADAATPPDVREAVRYASETWRAASGGRIQVTVAFDLEDPRAHLLGDLSLLLFADETDDLVRLIDSRHLRGSLLPMGAATWLPIGERWIVTIIPSRIPPGWLRAVVLHELGHVAGIDEHIPALGHVMSGRHLLGMAPAVELTPADFAACRAVLLCP